MTYFYVEDGRLRQSAAPPAEAEPVLAANKTLLPPLITDLHRQFKAWGDMGISPGPIVPARAWVSAQGKVAFQFDEGKKPTPLMTNVGQAPDLAAWFVLLDKVMETFVVVARARAIWSPDELGGALSFMTPSFLSPVLIAYPPDNWQRVAQALAVAVADQPTTHASNDRPWA